MVYSRIPTATYRLQFNWWFRFTDARALVPYLHALGITDLYASPLLKARQGSTHGYDVTDPTRLNPELGGEKAFAALTKVLKEYEMGLLLDIAPNHMAASSENPWWLDVLQNGQNSPYSAYFDIDWQPTKLGLINKVLLPILNAPYGKVLENQELTLILAEDGFWVCYHDRRLPLSPRSYGRILVHWLKTLTEAFEADNPVASQLADLVNILKKLPTRTEEHIFAVVFQQATERLWHLYSTSSRVKAFIDKSLQILNGRKEDPQSFDHLDQILTEQTYQLAFWRTANQEINYRRFFDISGLVSMRIEEEHVFAAAHTRILQLAKEEQVTGLRVDHIDGLHDPGIYLCRLQNYLSVGGLHPRFYVVVEKILGSDEELPVEWPVCGTTGYDFLNMVNGLFIDRWGATSLDEIYMRLSGSEADFSAVVYAQKQRVMVELFASEVRTLVQQLSRLAEQDRHGRDLTLIELEQALIKATACLPVYRTYIRDFTVADRDRAYIEYAFATAIRQNPAISRACDFLRRVLLLEFPGYLTAEQQQAWLCFVMRWQQFTTSIMAKGFEDTALYVYNRLLSLNEVGGNPQATGVSVVEFHHRNRDRQERWPHTINTTTTHDTKRSEDVRARINVLSEIPSAWAERLDRWCHWNRLKKLVVNGQPVPDGNAELLIYQTLIGAWPLREEEVPAFKERLEVYLVKAAREAKIHTSWLHPDTNYENALVNFVKSILKPTNGNWFLQDFLRFQKIIAYYGALGSLAQVLLKITSPGVPDFYQGTELWDFSLVDPDNRRPVDFKVRVALLATLQKQEASGLLALTQKLLASWEDGRIKLYLTYKTLHFRGVHRDLFATGKYLPIKVTGSRDEHVCAFIRYLRNTWALVVVPRLLARLQTMSQVSHSNNLPQIKTLVVRPFLGEAVWGKSALILPEHAPDHWYNALTGETVAVDEADKRVEGKTLPLASVFRNLPVALFNGKSIK